MSDRGNTERASSRGHFHDDILRRDAPATKPQSHNLSTPSRHYHLSSCVMSTAPKRVTRSQSKRKVLPLLLQSAFTKEC